MSQLKQAVSQSGVSYPLTGNTKRTTPRNHQKDREAREKYESRSKDRPVQVTAPTNDHVVGWNWPKVSTKTIEQIEEEIDEE